ncbi:pol-like protein [Triplophysa rosa]|uniref:Pol-like protein n=1 Tax=Triplophysa rosa TaxID=992332 RepID=A0A9W7TW48_TRIRA|nr:pol-like protein [Triplophysa rosa]
MRTVKKPKHMYSNRMFLFFRFFFSFLLFISMCEFNVATLNLNGARDMRKRAELFQVIYQKKIDIIMLQETHSDTSNAADWAVEWNGTTVLSHNTSLSAGVAILFTKGFSPHSLQVEEVIKGRLLKVRASFENSVFVFICVYSPTSAVERMLFLNTLCSVLQNVGDEEYLFLGGDFNCTESNLDRNHIEPHLPSRKRLIQLIKTHELSDIWRQRNGEHKQYSWSHVRGSLISLARLDRIYVFKYHYSVVKNCVITPSSLSDHSMVQCSVLVNFIKPKSAYWLLNTTLLGDSCFKKSFEFFWDEFRTTKKSFRTLQQWWDFGKVQTKVFCQQYSRNVTREVTIILNALETDILKLQELALLPGDQNGVESLLKNKKTQLADLLGNKAQGALVRSRFQSVNEMDVPSKFFFSLEKKNGQNRVIHGLLSESGTLLTDSADIRKRAVSFYENLYRNELGAEYDNDSDFFDNLPQVSEEVNGKISRPLTLGELHRALQGMNLGKAPGIDGLPVDFYKSFWSVIGEDLLEVLNDSLAGGLMPLSCRRAVLTLLPKRGDLTNIKCWRPVSLLCGDYKLFSKVLANRLAEVMDQVIHPDQTYCVPGRLIFDNVSLIRDLLDVSKMLNLDCGLISLDQEKAFDRVEHVYLWRVLEAFGFCKKFINQVKVLYSDVESILKVNGGLCAPFGARRGIRQGCPLSGMLYSLAIEPLLQQIRLKLHGIILPNCSSSFVLSAYADDIVVMVSRQNDVQILTELLRNFKVLSSANINWNKSEALLLGRWSNGKPKLPAGLQWGKEGFKYLGVFLGDEATVKKNWEGLIEKIEGRLKKWKYLFSKWSYRGRILVVNNLVASSLWHKFACVDPPLQLVAKIQAILVDFFWDKLHWVPQNVLFLPKEEGGQGLVHLQSRIAAFRLQFVQRLLGGPSNCSWRAVACQILRSFASLGLDKALFLMDPQKMNTSTLPVFYRNTFKVWSLFDVQRSEDSPSIFWLLEEPLIYGSRLDLMDSASFPGLSRLLLEHNIIILSQLLDIVGLNFKNEAALAQHLGVRSIRVAAQLLTSWKAVLNTTEIALLNDFCTGSCVPNSKDSFPCFYLSVNLEEVSSPFFENSKSLCVFSFFSSTGKSLYKACVLAFSKKGLNGKTDSPWRDVFNLDQSRKPEWRSLYKPPLTKRAGDLQWRILHGAVAVNAFISVLNPEVASLCPFCSVKETIFHAFMKCCRLEPLFVIVSDLFGSCNEMFSLETFILGFKYVRKKRFLCQLLNFVLGQAKLAIYVRKKKIEQNVSQNLVVLFSNMVKSRVLVDFYYYKSVNDLATFECIWCCKEVLCYVSEGELFFTHTL